MDFESGPGAYSRLGIGRFYTRDALPVWTFSRPAPKPGKSPWERGWKLGKHLLPVRLCVSSIKMGTRRVTRLDELYFVVRRSRRISKESLGKHLLPVWLCVSSIKMGTRRVTRLDELYFVVRRSRRISKKSSSSSRRVTLL